MKKVFALMLLAFCSVVCYSAEPALVPNKTTPIKATEVFVPVGKTGRLISIMELSQISVKDFENLTGKKMKFVDKVNFKIAQRKLRKDINDDGSFTSKKYEKYFHGGGPVKGISWGGLALGLFLSLIGVLIAYLISVDNRGPLIRWAWIGAIISLIVWGTILIV